MSPSSFLPNIFCFILPFVENIGIKNKHLFVAYNFAHMVPFPKTDSPGHIKPFRKKINSNNLSKIDDFHSVYDHNFYFYLLVLDIEFYFVIFLSISPSIFSF